MRMRYFLIVAACIMSGHAYAADVVRSYEAPEAPFAEAVAIPAAFSWDGVYLGGQIGGAWSDSDVDSLSPVVQSYSTDASGFIGGVYAGYNFSLGSDVILGVETDFNWGSLDDSRTINIGGIDTRAKIEQKWAGAVRLRAGYEMDRWLPYLAAGYAYARIDSQVQSNIALPGFQNSKTLSGWTVGVGSDYAILDNILLRAEYRYNDYGDDKYRTGSGEAYDVDYKTNDFRVGVAYKF